MIEQLWYYFFKNGSLHTPPNEILQLAEKTFLFKVEIKQNRMSNYEACYPVKRLTDDVGLIQKFIEMTPNQLVCVHKIKNNN